MTRNLKQEQILYGGDYNPEQWLDEPEILEKDVWYYVKKKHKLNVNFSV